MKTQSLLKGSAFFEKYIRKNFTKYLLILAIYLIGFIIGISIFNNNIKENDGQISQYVLDTISQIKETNDIIGEYIKQDFLEWLILSVLSFSVIGIPIILVLLLLKSISLGITTSALIYTSGAGMGMSFSILMFMIPVIIKIFTTLILVSSTFKFVENTLMYKKEFKYELVRHALVNIIAFLATCIIFVYRGISINILKQILF